MTQNIQFKTLDKSVVCYDPLTIDPETDDTAILAHISEVGEVTFYTDEVEEDIKERIFEAAEQVKAEFAEYWASLSVYKQYEMLVAQATVPQLLEIVRNNPSMAEAVSKYAKKIVFKENEDTQESLEKDTETSDYDEERE